MAAAAVKLGGPAGGGPGTIRREEDAALDTWSRQVLSRADGGNSFLFPPTQVLCMCVCGRGVMVCFACVDLTLDLTDTHAHHIASSITTPIDPQVTYHPAASSPTQPPLPTVMEPLTPLTPGQWVLQRHSVLGLCFHVDVEGAFTKPLKAYFVACSVLLVVFLSLRIQLGALTILCSLPNSSTD